jgi:hypothetical protein
MCGFSIPAEAVLCEAKPTKANIEALSMLAFVDIKCAFAEQPPLCGTLKAVAKPSLRKAP